MNAITTVVITLAYSTTLRTKVCKHEVYDDHMTHSNATLYRVTHLLVEKGYVDISLTHTKVILRRN